jgi:hypothetical protein
VLIYKPRAVLNLGFAPGAVTMESLEAEEILAPSLASPFLVAYVRAIGAKAGDVQKLTIVAPDGRKLVEHSSKPLDRDKAQVVLFVGKRAPAEGWPKGTYRAVYTISAGGKVVLEHDFTIEF